MLRHTAVLLGCAATLSSAGGWKLFRAHAWHERTRLLELLAQHGTFVNPEMREIGFKLASYLGAERSNLLVRALILKLHGSAAQGGRLLQQTRHWVREDFVHARLIPVHGVNFSHTEAAFLIAVIREDDLL